MMISKPDLIFMRWSILAICASALVSAIALYASGEYAKTSQHGLRNAQAMLNDARNRLATAHQDQENMAIYTNEYDSLNERGIFGDDHRLDWMEGLERIRQKNLATDFRFNIAPQKTYAMQPPADSGNFDIHYSEMKLQLDLLHEGQLLDFLNALRSQIKGWYQLEGCTLQRATKETGGATASMQLTAECVGGWVTLKNRNAP